MFEIWNQEGKPENHNDKSNESNFHFHLRYERKILLRVWNKVWILSFYNKSVRGS